MICVGLGKIMDYGWFLPRNRQEMGSEKNNKKDLFESYSKIFERRLENNIFSQYSSRFTDQNLDEVS